LSLRRRIWPALKRSSVDGKISSWSIPLDPPMPLVPQPMRTVWRHDTETSEKYAFFDLKHHRINTCVATFSDVINKTKTIFSLLCVSNFTKHFRAGEIQNGFWFCVLKKENKLFESRYKQQKFEWFRDSKRNVHFVFGVFLLST